MPSQVCVRAANKELYILAYTKEIVNIFSILSRRKSKKNKRCYVYAYNPRSTMGQWQPPLNTNSLIKIHRVYKCHTKY